MTSAWEGSALVSQGTSISASGTSAGVKEVYAVSADGTLSIDISTTAVGAAASSIKYTRIKDVGPCGSWPTPCKRAK